MFKNLSIQFVVFFSIYQLLTWFKESDMLSRNDSITEQVFTLPTTAGEQVKLHSQGQTTVIYFFAPWCQVCHASIDNLQALYQKNERLNVIAVALDYINQAEIDDFTQTHQLTFPVAYGNEQVKTMFKIKAYPSYYVVDEENTVISKSMGYSTELGLYLRSL